VKAEWVAADRAAEVRGAARDWCALGIIDVAALDAVDRLYPDDRVRLSLLWRVLVFICVTLAACALFAFVVMALGIESNARALSLTALVYGAALAVVTETLRGKFRYEQTGGESATSLAAVVALAAGILLYLEESLHTMAWEQAVSLALIGLLGLAAWRFGYLLYAGAATVFLFAFLSTLSRPRLLWMTVGAVVAAVSALTTDRQELSPSHRHCLMAVQAISLTALYATVNAYAVEHRWIEVFASHGARPTAEPGSGGRLLYGIGTALFPAAVLAWGLVSRRKLQLDLGILLAALSLITLRHYIHIAPLWVVLSASGAGLILCSLAVQRLLDEGPGGEKAGFTAASLQDDRQRERMLSAAAALSVTPAARASGVAPEEFRGGGGRFGGGGADANW
jgi:hypothetical protein